MIETVFLDWGLAFGSGVLFALAGRTEIARSPRRLRTRAFRWGFAYLHLGLLSISVSLYLMSRDWMWMYWIDPRGLPIGIQVVAFVMYEVCFVAGFLLSVELSKRSALIMAALTALGITVLEVSARTRLFHFGTLDQFRAGTARPAIRFSPLSAPPEWWLVSVGGLASLAAMAVLLLRLARRDKEPEPARETA